MIIVVAAVAIFAETFAVAVAVAVVVVAYVASAAVAAAVVAAVTNDAMVIVTFVDKKFVEINFDVCHSRYFEFR